MPQSLSKYRALGPACKQYRQRAQLSQMDVAQSLGYGSAQIISNFERGLCSLPHKKLFEYGRLCKIPESVVLGIELADHLYQIMDETKLAIKL